MNNKLHDAHTQEQAHTGQWFDSVWFRTLSITVFLLGMYFRFSGLGNKMYSHDEIYTSLYGAGYRGGDAFTSLWDGKTKTIEDLQVFLKPGEEQSISQVLSAMALYSPHQAPLYFLFTHYWMQFVGYTPAFMRGLAALFGFSSIPAMYWLAKELFRSKRPAILSAVLFAISPFHILFSQDARPYSLWTLITILSSAALLRAMRKNNWFSWTIYCATLVLGVYSHQLFVLVAIVHAAYFAGVQLKTSGRNYGGFALASSFAFLVYTPWLLYLITRWHQAAAQLDVLSMRIAWYRFIQRWILLFSSPLFDVDFNSNAANLLLYLLRSVLLILIGYAFLFVLKRASYGEKLFLALVYVIAAGSFIFLDLLFGGMRSITGRYFVPANIATLLVVAYFLTSRLDEASREMMTKWQIGVTLLVLASVLSNINSLHSETWWNKELGRVRTEFIHEISHPGALLIVSGEHPTNLGDVLLLGFEVDPDVNFRLYRHPADIKLPATHSSIYWFPSTSGEIHQISTKEQFEVREVLPGILWQIELKDD